MIVFLLLTIRIVLLSFERILLKIMGKESIEDKSVSVTFLFFSIGSIALFPFSIMYLILDFSILLNSYISSLIYSIAFVLYSSSLKEGDVSLVTPLYNFNIVFLMVFSFIFLNEAITIFRVFGIILMFFGISFLEKGSNFTKSIRNVFSNKACRLMIVSSLLVACGRIIDSFSVKTANPSYYAFLIYLFVSINLGLVLLIRKMHNEPLQIVRKLPLISISSGLVNSFSYLALLFALNFIDISIAEPLSALNIFLALILAYKFLKEDIQHRWIAALFVLIGVFLIFI
ncbi:MAG: EamA family transporter [Candidatus Ranarchaeia archaeon]